MTITATPIDELELPLFDFVDERVAANPYEEARRLARESWLARTPQGYAVLRFEDAKALNRDPRLRTPEGLGLAAQGITEGVAFEWASGTVLGLDGEDHARIRRLAQPGFTPQKLEEVRPFARSLFASILDDVVPKGRGEAGEICRSYSVRVICNLLGWPDDDWEQLIAWAVKATEVISVAMTPELLAECEAVLSEMRAYTLAKLEEQRGRQGDDIGSAIMAAGEDGDALSALEVAQLFETLLVGGSDTTMATLGHALRLFALHPDQYDRLCADPSLVPSAVEEVLRFRPPTLATARVAREDVVHRDVLIPAGTFLTICQASANFDPEAYDEPERFDVGRYADGSTLRVPKPAHMSFGFGPHVCIGNFLARVELQEAFKLLTERLHDLRIDDADPRGVEWNSPYSIHGPIHLPLTWTPVG